MSPSIRMMLICLTAVAVAGGCDDQPQSSRPLVSSPAPRVTDTTDIAWKTQRFVQAVAKQSLGSDALKPALPAGLPQTSRRVIQEAVVFLAVDNFDGVDSEVQQLAATFNGFVSQSQVQSDRGLPRSGQWTLRTPSDHLHALLDAVSQLGELKQVNSHSQEVTWEYIDLEARLLNKQHEETRLLEHLRTNTAALEDILKVEQELSRVRSEVERIQGRLRLLGDLTEMSTLTIHISELRDFTPAQTQSPGFLGRLHHAWWSSLDTLWGLVQTTAVALVAAAPWLIVLSVPGWLGWCRFAQHQRQRTATV